MRYLSKLSAALSMIIVFLLASNTMADLTVGNYTLINSKRITRVDYEYTYKAQITNSSLVGYTGVSATVTSNDVHTVIVENQISFPDVSASSSIASNDTFTIRHNRSYPLIWDNLTWIIGSTVLPHEVTISGKVVGGAPMVGTVNLKDSSNPPLTSFSSIGIDGSYTLNIDSNWQPPLLLWANGYVSGEYRTLLSFIDFEIEDVSIVCNVTPATTAVVASAIGEQIENVDPASAQLPASMDVVAVKERVQDVLVHFFAAFDLPETFDLFESPIVLGEGSDLMFDAMAFSTNDVNHVVLTSKIDPTIELAITDTTTPADGATLVNDIQNSNDALAQFGHYFSTLYSLYESGPADLPTLQSTMAPLIAEEIVSAGLFGRTNLFESWAATPTRAPAVGTEFVSCSIYRPMQLQHYGSRPVHEMPDSYSQGMWVIVTVMINGKLHTELTSFVLSEDGNWLCYGNRRPFVSGGYVRPRCEKTISPIGSLVYESGLIFYNNDIGNSALTNLGMTQMAAFNPAMPDESIEGINTNCLRIARSQGGLSTQYYITNVGTQSNAPFYFHRGDGAAKDLNLSALASQQRKEFIMIGLNETEEPVYVWTQVLGGMPTDLDEAIADDSKYFASIQTPAGFDDINIPGITEMSWVLPENDELIASFGKLEWYNQNWLFHESYDYNPALFGPANYGDFTSAVIDSTGYYESVRQARSDVMMHRPANQSEFRVNQEYNAWVAKNITINNGQLVIDVEKAYNDNRLSSRLEAAVRATDRAINRLQADVSLDLSVAEGNVDTINNNMYAEIRLLYQPSENWSMGNRTDLIIVGVRLQPWFGRLYLVGYTWGSQNADGSVLYTMPTPVGDYPFNTELTFGTAYTIAAEYIAASNSLKIEFNGQSSLYSMDGLPFDPANFQAAEIRTQVVGIVNPDDRGRIRTTVDNVRIDGIDYDNFNTGISDNRWWLRAFE